MDPEQNQESADDSSSWIRIADGWTPVHTNAEEKAVMDI